MVPEPPRSFCKENMPSENSVNLWKLQQARMNGDLPSIPEYLQHADKSATDAELAYKEALSGVPDRPNPSGWRKLAAVAAGALGGYHQQFVDPRMTAAATQGILEGDYPQRYAKAQAVVKRAEHGIILADKGIGRATDRYRVEQDNETKKSNAQLLSERTRQGAMDRFNNTIGTRSRALTPEEVTDPTILASVKAGTHAFAKDPEGGVHLTETPAFIRSENERKSMEMLRQQIADRAARSADTIEAQNQRNADTNANRLLITGMLKAGQDGDSKTDKRIAATEALRLNQEESKIWSRKAAAQNVLDAEARTLDPAVFQGKSNDAVAQKRFAMILNKSTRLHNEAVAEVAALRNKDVQTYLNDTAKFRPPVKGGDPTQPEGDGPKTSPVPASVQGDVLMLLPDGVTKKLFPAANVAAAEARGAKRL